MIEVATNGKLISKDNRAEKIREKAREGGYRALVIEAQTRSKLMTADFAIKEYKLGAT